MKKLLAVFTLFILFSCQIEYDGTTKFIVKAKVVDKDGLPIANIPVTVRVSVSNLSDDISFSNSDTNGNATMMFPPPTSSNATFSIFFDTTYYDGAPSIYSPKLIYNVNKANFKSYLFDAGTIVMYKNSELTELTISKTQINPSTEIIALSTTAIKAKNEINYNAVEETWYPSNFLILKNQTFMINYTVKNTSTSPATTTSYSEEVSVGTEPLVYTIEY